VTASSFASNVFRHLEVTDNRPSELAQSGLRVGRWSPPSEKSANERLISVSRSPIPPDSGKSAWLGATTT
jgi:hypothetical protein